MAVSNVVLYCVKRSKNESVEMCMSSNVAITKFFLGENILNSSEQQYLFWYTVSRNTKC